jgi:xanthine dehydrogenase accessory factor
MFDELLAVAADLQRRGEPFALATVVRCERPTSAKPGAKALIRADGTISGWVGGACAEPVVVREALAALRDGQPRLVGLVGDSGRGPGRTEGMLEYPMTCHSGGTLEIYVEPYLPKPLLLIVGHGPVVETLATLARATEYAVVVTDGRREALTARALTLRTFVVVATHGDADEEALERILQSDAGYVSLLASRRRAAVIVESLRRRGVPLDRLGRLKAPAGLDIGAVSPHEIAVSILAEIIQHHRGPKQGGLVTDAATPVAEATDPVCGMAVEVATAPHRSETAGRVVYFCCRHCKERFDLAPEAYPAGPSR